MKYRFTPLEKAYSGLKLLLAQIVRKLRSLTGFKMGHIYVLARFIGFFLFLVPMKIAVFLGGELGGLAFYLLPKHRQTAIDNLKNALGKEKSDSQILKITHNVFRNLGKSAAEFINYPKISADNVDKLVRIQGIEKINKALKAGNGCIILSSHLGNWELSAAYFGLKGYPVNVIARPLRYHKLDKLVNSARRSKNINVISRDDSFKKLLSVLKNNEIIGILPDQDIESLSGVYIDFFGSKAYTPTGPVALAIISGAPVFPVFCIRQSDNTHKIIVEPEIKLEITGDRQKDILVNTQKWSDIFEHIIRQHPSLWVWIHKRWKTQRK